VKRRGEGFGDLLLLLSLTIFSSHSGDTARSAAGTIMNISRVCKFSAPLLSFSLIIFLFSLSPYF
jgi:hypothetical protein